MGLTPLLYAGDIDRSMEVVAVIRFIEPAPLAFRFGGLSAFRFRAESLPMPVPIVGGEEVPAAHTLTLSDSFCH